jgi:hypothetical protein
MNRALEDRFHVIKETTIEEVADGRLLSPQPLLMQFDLGCDMDQLNS